MSDQGGDEGTNITRRLGGGQALAEMLKAHGVGFTPVNGTQQAKTWS